MNPTTTLRLAERLANGEIDLSYAMGEAAGAISVCWDEDGIFLSDRADAILEDLQDALAKAVELAVETADLGSAIERGGWENWRVTELLLQQPSLGFVEAEED